MGGDRLDTRMATSSRPPSRTLGQFVWTNDGSSLPRDSISTAIADMVARRRGVDPTDDDFRLYDFLDPDALDDLYAHSRRHGDASWRLEFDLGEEAVVVRSDGVVQLDDEHDRSP